VKIKLHLSIYPRARNIDKARKAIVRVQERLTKDLKVNNIEKNISDESTFRVDCTIPLESNSLAEALYESLEMCQNIAIAWLVFGPEKRFDGHWQFHATAYEPMNVQGIKYVGFEISDGPIPQVITVNADEI
jgi:hypothetical protein